MFKFRRKRRTAPEPAVDTRTAAEIADEALANILAAQHDLETRTAHLRADFSHETVRPGPTAV